MEKLIEERMNELGLGETINPVICRDGFMVVIMTGSEYHSLPKTDVGPWTHYELYYGKNGDSDGGNTSTLVFDSYPYQPKAQVATLLRRHGGPDDSPRNLRTELILQTLGFEVER